jgi:hypothetical protein
MSEYRALIIHWERDIAEWMAYSLEFGGIRTDIYWDLSDALRALKAQKYCLLTFHRNVRFYADGISQLPELQILRAASHDRGADVSEFLPLLRRAPTKADEWHTDLHRVPVILHTSASIDTEASWIRSCEPINFLLGIVDPTSYLALARNLIAQYPQA